MIFVGIEPSLGVLSNQKLLTSSRVKQLTYPTETSSVSSGNHENSRNSTGNLQMDIAPRVLVGLSLDWCLNLVSTGQNTPCGQLGEKLEMST
mmetsp:Transcript_12899/g.28101  ORF Transcript_12899/g.28101 Transcript_12899/m.28101 type:complete len:92 (-) Transcript_12899:522-797(-)